MTSSAATSDKGCQLLAIVTAMLVALLIVQGAEAAAFGVETGSKKKPSPALKVALAYISRMQADNQQFVSATQCGTSLNLVQILSQGQVPDPTTSFIANLDTAAGDFDSCANDANSAYRDVKRLPPPAALKGSSSLFLSAVVTFQTATHETANDLRNYANELQQWTANGSPIPTDQGTMPTIPGPTPAPPWQAGINSWHQALAQDLTRLRIAVPAWLRS